MSRNSGGTYTLPATYNPVVTNTAITILWANTTLTDIETEITDSLNRSGKGGMLAPLKTTDGSASAPAWAFSNDANTGMYRVGADTLGFTSGSTLRLSVNATGNWVMVAPSTGTAVTVNGIGGGIIAVLAATEAATMLSMQDGTRTAVITTNATYGTLYGCTSNHGVSLISNNSTRLEIAAAGNVTVNAPASGVGLTVTGLSGSATAVLRQGVGGNAYLSIAGNNAIAGTNSFDLQQDSTNAVDIVNRADTRLSLYTNNTERVRIAAAGNVTITAPTGGVGLTVAGGGIAVTGASTFSAGLTIAGALAGVTTLSIGGALSGVTTGAFSGAVSMAGLTATTGAFSGAVSMTALTATTGAFSGDISAANFAATSNGTFTPTFTSTLNLDGNPSATGTWKWSRVGNTVTFSGKCSLDPTAAGSLAFRGTLPVASNFAASTDCNGTIGSTSGDIGCVEGDSTNDNFAVSAVVVGTGSRSMWVVGQYLVI